jgi:PIN domain nuclease of toxin-antitoxin system
MNVLLDSHLVLWMQGDDRRLGKNARALIRRAANVYISAATVWELAIKVGLGRLKLNLVEFDASIDASGLQVLPVSRQHGLLVARLPDHHRDPFDRLLVAQAMEEGLTLLTHDATVAKYSHTLLV